MANLIAQKKPVIGKRGLTYPTRVNKHVGCRPGFDEDDTVSTMI